MYMYTVGKQKEQVLLVLIAVSSKPNPTVHYIKISVTT